MKNGEQDHDESNAGEEGQKARSCKAVDERETVDEREAADSRFLVATGCCSKSSSRQAPKPDCDRSSTSKAAVPGTAAFFFFQRAEFHSPNLRLRPSPRRPAELPRQRRTLSRDSRRSGHALAQRTVSVRKFHLHREIVRQLLPQPLQFLGLSHRMVQCRRRHNFLYAAAVRPER